jgi:uncharacterized membrane protein YfcA
LLLARARPAVIAEIFTWPHALAVVTVIVAGVVRGFTGFGSALLMVPILALLWSPTTAVTTAFGVGIMASLQLVPKAARQANWREIGPMAVATVLVTPLGTMILLGVEPAVMRRIIAALILLVTLVFLWGWQYRGPRGPGPGFLAGATGAIINGVAGVGGPAVVLYLISLPDSVAVQRANIVVQISLMGFVGLVYLALADVVGRADLIRIAALALPMLLGTTIGSHLFRRLPNTLFRVVVLWTLVVVSVCVLVF